jgi:hypothetical protein
MKLDELKAKVEAKRKTLNSRETGSIQLADKNGPIGIDLIDALMVVIEDQQQRLEALEKRLG